MRRETEQPLVSIIMPVYNGSTSIEDAIRSVTLQSYRNVELIVINDGSSDDTEEIVYRLMILDSRIRYFQQRNKGVSAARNVGLQTMRGSFFTFLDADDCLTSESIAARMSKFQEDNSLAFCDGGVTVFDDSMKVPKRCWQPSQNGYVFKRLLMLSESCFFGPTWLVKRDGSRVYSFEEDMTHGEDLFFFMGIAKFGRYDFVDQEILKYRTSRNSAMRNLKALANGYNMLFEKVRHTFGHDITIGEMVYLWIRIRIVMTLSFAGERQFLNAFLFLLSGKVK